MSVIANRAKKKRIENDRVGGGDWIGCCLVAEKMGKIRNP